MDRGENAIWQQETFSSHSCEKFASEHLVTLNLKPHPPETHK